MSVPAPLNFASVRKQEIDRSIFLFPESAVSFGALGYFSNGPVKDIIQLSDKDTLAGLFGEPNSENFNEWYQIARAFNYRAGAIGPTAKILRVIGDGSTNGALAVTNTGLVNETDLTTMTINNEDDALAPTVVFDTNTVANGGDDSETKIKFFTKYPTEANYKIALANATDFSTADIDTGISFQSQFSVAPKGTEVAYVVIIDGEIVEKKIVDITDGNVDGFGESNYIETVINEQSLYLLAYVNEDVTDGPASFEATSVMKGSVVPPVTSDYIDALSEFEDIESIDINYFLGHNEVISECMTLCENRDDCQMIWTGSPSMYINKPNTTILADLVEYTTTTLNRNTTYAEFFGNAGLIRDTYNKKTRWVGLAGDLIGLRILKNLTGNPWQASAGLLSGQIRDIIKLAWNPKPAEMNTMGKNKINPIVSKVGKGIVSWGIRNYTSVESTLTDSTTRGLVNYIWRASRDFLENFLFEINDEITRNNLKAKVDQFMENVQNNRGVYDFRTICSEVNNTPQVIDQGQLVLELRIKPTRIAREIVFQVALYGSGADLTVQ